jgi:hypothetical protein
MRTLWTRPGHSKISSPYLPSRCPRTPLSGNDEDPHSGPNPTIPPRPTAGQSLFTLNMTVSSPGAPPHELCSAANDYPVAVVAVNGVQPPCGYSGAPHSRPLEDFHPGHSDQNRTAQATDPPLIICFPSPPFASLPWASDVLPSHNTNITTTTSAFGMALRSVGYI